MLFWAYWWSGTPPLPVERITALFQPWKPLTRGKSGAFPVPLQLKTGLMASHTYTHTHSLLTCSFGRTGSVNGVPRAAITTVAIPNALVRGRQSWNKLPFQRARVRIVPGKADCLYTCWCVCVCVWARPWTLRIIRARGHMYDICSCLCVFEIKGKSHQMSVFQHAKYLNLQRYIYVLLCTSQNCVPAASATSCELRQTEKIRTVLFFFTLAVSQLSDIQANGNGRMGNHLGGWRRGLWATFSCRGSSQVYWAVISQGQPFPPCVCAFPSFKKRSIRSWNCRKKKSNPVQPDILLFVWTPPGCRQDDATRDPVFLPAGPTGGVPAANFLSYWLELWGRQPRPRVSPTPYVAPQKHSNTPAVNWHLIT